ncbi:MAG: hypothetical protein L0229_10065 [Blastocatellia bacterium]|nr:hypothetical protein [Blastocatellia bacterium]
MMAITIPDVFLNARGRGFERYDGDNGVLTPEEFRAYSSTLYGFINCILVGIVFPDIQYGGTSWPHRDNRTRPSAPNREENRDA